MADPRAKRKGALIPREKAPTIDARYLVNGVSRHDLSSGSVPTAWSAITGKPTTLAGYGITDAASDAELATEAAARAAADTALAAPVYIVQTATATLANERVLTDTATVTWDFSTPGQAKATSSGSGAPTTVDYLVKTADAGLSAERVVTDTTSITVDWSTAGQAKFQRAALTGDVTASANSNATTIAVVTTKGDLLGYDTVPKRVPVGTDGYLLGADSDAALGVAYQANPLHGIPRTGAGVYEFGVSYDAGTRTWTLTPTGASFYVWIQGRRYKFTGVQTVTHANTNGGHFCYFNSSGVLTTATTPWDILTTAQVAFVLFHTTDGAILSLDERHAADRDARWHANAHHVIGTSVKATPGIPTLSGYTLSTATTAAVSWALTTFTVADEDIEAATDAVTDGGATSYPLLYRDASGDWRRTTATFGDGSGIPFATSGGVCAYNQLGVGLTPLTLTGSGQYVNVYIFGTTEHTSSRRVFLLAGQTVYLSLADAQAAAATADIAWGSQSPTENVAVYRLTYWAKNSHGATSHYAVLAGVQALLGSRVSTVVAPVTSHASLTALPWVGSGHTGTAGATPQLAAFNTSGVAVEVPLGASGGAEEYGKIAGVTISGTPSAGQVPVASSSSAAAWSSIPFMYVIPGSLYQVPACMWNGGTLGTGSAIAANVYKAMPFIAPFSGTIDLIAIQVITAIAASNAVIAIWSDSGGVPGSVLGQATVSTATTGSKSGAVSITVEFGRLYWSTYLGSAAGVVLRGPPTASLMAPGYALTAGDTAARVKLEVAQAYASPTPAWPGGASWVTSASSVAYVFYQRAT